MSSPSFVCKTRVYDRREWMRIAAASSAVNEATAEAEVAHVLEKGMPERRRSFENFVEREVQCPAPPVRRLKRGF